LFIAVGAAAGVVAFVIAAEVVAVAVPG